MHRFTVCVVDFIAIVSCSTKSPAYWHSTNTQGTLYVSVDHEIRYVTAETDSKSLLVGKLGVFTSVGLVDNF